MSESLRNDGRIWVPKKLEDVKAIREGNLKPTEIKEEDRDYYLERRYPAFGNLVPRDVASRAAKERCDAGFGVNKTGEAVYLDFASAITRYGKEQAHVKGLNNSSLGVCLIGSTKFTNKKFISLKKVLLNWKKKYPKAKILGHRDSTETTKTCPNFDVVKWCKENLN